MTAIGSGLPAAPPIPARDEARRDGGSASTGATAATAGGMSAIQADATQRFVAPVTQTEMAGDSEVDRAKLAMLPERFWPYEIWLREKGWTKSDDAGKSVEAEAAEANNARAYRESAQRAAETQRAELEAALAERNRQVPDEVSAAVKLVGALRDEKGAPSGLALEIDRQQRAEEAPTVDDKAVKASDPASKLFAQHGTGRPLVEIGKSGRARLGSFALTGLAGDHAVRHDGRTGAVTLWRGGSDITSAAIKGDAFG